MSHDCKCLQRLVALDVEGVLANIHVSWISHYKKKFTASDIADWDFNNLRKWNETLKSFLYETDALWENNPQQAIPPAVQDLKRVTSYLKPFDIVTSRKSLGGIKEWVDYHQIEYRALVYIPEGKAVLNYQIYIDDNPNLAAELKDNQFLWLIDQPYNQGVADSKNVRRVRSITDVVLD